MDAHTLPCGCEWVEGWKPGVRFVVEYTRRCAKHGKRYKRTIPKIPKAKMAVGATLPWGRDISERQAAAYEKLMGRPWSDPDPRREDYGAPEYPGHVHFGDPEWETAYTEYEAAFKAWETTDAAKQYDEDWKRWNARREQFQYSPRARNAKDVLAKAMSAG